MATIPRADARGDLAYPTSDGKPMAETDFHRQIMVDLIDVFEARYADDPQVYVSGDLLLFYEEGNKRKHVAPDVLVAFGVSKAPQRLHYLLWREGKAPDVVIEVTSKTTRKEDQTKKLVLYRDVLRIPEYFLFDPFNDYLRPSLQGHRLTGDGYIPIELVSGRLLSKTLGVFFERSGTDLHVVDATSNHRLLTARERAKRANTRAEQADTRAAQSEARNLELQREIEDLRRQLAERQAGS
jgi:Uma2 family endonuclease